MTMIPLTLWYNFERSITLRYLKESFCKEFDLSTFYQIKTYNIPIASQIIPYC